MPAVIPGRCPRNHPCPCVGLCPVGAISQEGFDAPKVDPTLCTECLLCVRSCPYGAFLETPADVPQHV